LLDTESANAIGIFGRYWWVWGLVVVDFVFLIYTHLIGQLLGSLVTIFDRF